uniref:Uncharacterized protein n=1 Tax=Quercus lobata TaxID=97700 RepID=A0A7N2R5M1_QUELO
MPVPLCLPEIRSWRLGISSMSSLNAGDSVLSTFNGAMFLRMGKLIKLIETEEAMEKFIIDYRIPPNVGLRYCEEGEWHFRRKAGKAVIPLLAFIEGGVRIPIGPTKDDKVQLIQCLSESNKVLNKDFLIVSGEWHDGLPCPMVDWEPDPHSFQRHFHLTNREDLETILRAAVFVNEADNQVRATHKILGYNPIQRSFIAPKHVIRANNPQLQKITVAEHGFLIPKGSPVPEGIPLAGSSSSHQVAEVESDSGLPKEGFDVFDQANPSKDPSRYLGDLDLSKPESTDSKRKRSSKGKEPMDGEKSRMSQDKGEASRAQKQLKIGHQGQGKEVDAQFAPEAWLLVPMLHEEPLMENASLRDFRSGEGTYVANALERTLLLPTDMDELKNIRRQEVFLIMKRYLGMGGSEMTKARDNVEVGLAGAQKEAEDQTRHLLEAEGQLKITKEQNDDLKKKLSEVEKARGIAK